jgi:Na+/H+-translocating membrane pyrophosphatase
VRTILIHVNAQVPDDDPRSAKEIADEVGGAMEVGWDNPALADVTAEIVLVKETWKLEG